MSGILKRMGSIIGIGRDDEQDARKAAEVEAVLNDALASRVRMDVQVVGEETRSRPMRGVCVALKPATLLLDVDLYSPVSAWIGEKAHVYFQLRDDKGVENYDFSVPILDIPRHGDGYALQLKMPRELNHNQKRMFVRVKPPAELVSELAFWHLPDDRDQPKNFSHLRQAFCAGDLSIEDISAGGVRLAMDPLDPVVSSFSAGSIGIMHLVVRDKDDREPVDLWLVCECVLIRSEETSPTIAMSFKFRKWAREPAGNEDFTWLPIRPTDGVPSLTAWIMRRQLEAARAGRS